MSLRGDAFCIATSSDNHFWGLPVLRTTSIHPGNQSRRDCFKTQNEQSHGDLSQSGGDSFAERFRHCVVMPFASRGVLSELALKRPESQHCADMQGQISLFDLDFEGPLRAKKCTPALNVSHLIYQMDLGEQISIITFMVGMDFLALQRARKWLRRMDCDF